MDGAGGVNTADYSGVGGAVLVQINGATNGIANIGTVTGNNTDSTLVGDNAVNTFNITGINDGDVGAVNFVAPSL